MSSREAFLPSRAFGDIIRDLRRRYERASRRLDWNSATQDAYAPESIPARMLSFDGPVIPVEADQTVLAELTVDRGKWVVFGSAYGSVTRVGSDFPFDYPGYCGLTIYSDGQMLDATSTFGWLASVPLDFPGSVVGVLSAEHPARVTLYGWVQTDLAAGSAEFSQIRLTAVAC